MYGLLPGSIQVEPSFYRIRKYFEIMTNSTPKPFATSGLIFLLSKRPGFLGMRCLLLGIALLFLSSSALFAQQDGTYNTRLVVFDVDCANSKIYVDIEVRAEDPGTTFNIADMNYRISYNRVAVANPVIHKELTISGFTPPSNPTSFYAPHTLTGSADTIISYNVELSGGPGVFLDDINYVKVGRLAFDVLSFSEDLLLEFHTKEPVDFPPTIITAKDAGGTLYNTNEGSYGDYLQYLGDACVNAAPTVADDNATTMFNTPLTLNVVANDTDPTLNLSSISLISAPLTSEGTASIDNTTGDLTFIPAGGFFGTVGTFQYQICDSGLSFPTAHGNLNTAPIPLPDPSDPPIAIGGPACSIGNISIEVTTVSAAAQLNLRVLLEAAYNTGSEMTTTLAGAGIIPTSQPYHVNPWNYLGDETAASIPANVTDWVMITFRTEANSTSVVDTIAGLLRMDGQVVGTDGGTLELPADLPAVPLYVAVYHRNHVGIMTADPVPMLSGIYTYDFTDSATKAFGGLLSVNEIAPGLFGMISGDINGNGQVQNTDYNGMKLEIGLSGYRPADCNLNSQAQNSDLQEDLTPNIGRGANFAY